MLVFGTRPEDNKEGFVGKSVSKASGKFSDNCVCNGSASGDVGSGVGNF